MQAAKAESVPGLDGLEALARVPLLVALAFGLAAAVIGGVALLAALTVVVGVLVWRNRDRDARRHLCILLVPLVILPCLWWPVQGLQRSPTQTVVPRAAGLVVLEVREGGRPVADGQRVMVTVYRWDDQVGERLAERVQATLPEAAPPLRTGALWLAYGSLHAPSQPLHGWAFDPERFALARGVQGSFRLRGDEMVLLAQAQGWRAWLDQRRHALESSIAERHAPQEAGVLMAMLTGSRGRLDREVRHRFAAQGVAHVLAVSGLHMALVLLLAWRLLTALLAALPERLGVVPPRWAAAVILPLVPLYVVLTGGSSSARRAGVMVAVVLLAWLAARPVSALRALSLAFVAWLFLEPGLAEDLGFQLSVSATAGLILLGSGLPSAAQIRSNRGLRRRVAAAGRRLGQALVVGQVAAMATLVPLLGVFGEAPLLSPFANLVVVPPLTLVAMPAALAATVAEVILPPLAGPLWWVAGGAVHVALRLALWVDPWLSQPWVWGRPSGWGAVGWSGLAVATILAGRWLLSSYLAGRPACPSARASAFAALWVAAVSIVLLSLDLPPAWRAPDGVRVHAIPVGHGDASLIELPCGTRLLLDAGGRGFDGGGVGRAAVLSFLRGRGIRRVDVFISSHGHADHAGGLVELMPLLRPSEIWVGPVDPTTNLMDAALVAAAQRHGVRWVELDVRPRRLERGHVSIDILPRMQHAPSINDASLVLRLCFKGTCMLFPGDAESAREAALLEVAYARQRLPAHVLKIGHHGSRTSSSPSWLTAVAPDLAVLHVGRRFGHPHSVVMERFTTLDVPVLRTDRGAILTVVLHRGRIETFALRSRRLPR